MNIRVTFNTLSYDDVCDLYNRKKEEDMMPISKLDRMEGGFQIEIKGYEPTPGNIYSYDANASIKQVRWQNKWLRTDTIRYNPFDEKETQLLYETFIELYGDDKVFLEKFMYK